MRKSIEDLESGTIYRKLRRILSENEEGIELLKELNSRFNYVKRRSNKPRIDSSLCYHVAGVECDNCSVRY